MAATLDSSKPRSSRTHYGVFTGESDRKKAELRIRLLGFPRVDATGTIARTAEGLHRPSAEENAGVDGNPVRTTRASRR